MRSVTGSALVVAVLCSAAPVWAQQTAPPSQQLPVIVTRGEASLKRAPDQAFVSIAAEARAASPAEAQRNAADSMKAVQAAISKAGISNEAVRTTGYSMQPDMEYTNGRSRVRGYIVRNQLEVRVDDLEKLAGVIDAAGQSGATSMAGLRFDLKDRATVEREALRLAVQDAMARARAIASGANAQLGAIVRIDEQGGYEPPQIQAMSAMRMEKAADTPVSPGELEVRAQVMLTVGIR
ncbi:MAG TPA: SIMPL domain-containing protein [Vicinamibacterales bacterium]|nr:SIMPL domain-containing protein [Vicinamibacterales bacterium]